MSGKHVNYSLITKRLAAWDWFHQTVLLLFKTNEVKEENFHWRHLPRLVLWQLFPSKRQMTTLCAWPSSFQGYRHKQLYIATASEARDNPWHVLPMSAFDGARMWKVELHKIISFFCFREIFSLYGECTFMDFYPMELAIEWCCNKYFFPVRITSLCVTCYWKFTSVNNS